MSQFTRIEDYKNGLLSTELQQQFLQDLQSDSALEKEFRFSEAIDRAIGDERARNFERALKSAHKTYERKHSYTLLLKAAASLAILAVIGGSALFYMNGRPSGMEKIAGKYYEVYQPLNGLRSADPGQNQNIRTAFDAYRNGNYDAAISLFDRIAVVNPANIQVRFYQAVSYLEIDKPGQAISMFTAIIEARDNFYTPLAEYYLGMSYLKTGDKNAAIRQFEKIASQQGGYQAKAKEILKELKSL
jgi:tetratricopeptide (TPR) repeat protein